MGPAVFVLRGKYVPQHETAPRGTALGRKRASAAGEGTGRETVYSQDGQNPGKTMYKRYKTC